MDRNILIDRFMKVRALTEELVKPLATEDFVVQTDDDVSPPKWHIGHVTWFFERVVLQEHLGNFKPYDERFHFVFNSYY